MTVVAIVNPRSGGGRTGTRLDELRRELAARTSEGEVWTTQGPGDGVALAARAVREGASRVVAVGGDGTVHEVVNGLLSEGRERCDVPFGVVHAGTGGDFVKTLGMPSSLGASLDRVLAAEPSPCDAMRCGLRGHDGAARVEICVNVLGFGLNGVVVQNANRSSKRLGGRATFALATLRAVAGYTAPVVRVGWNGPDGEGSWEGRLSSAFVANGAHCGGGMTVGKGILDDGIVDLTIIPETPLLRTIRSLPRLYDGSLGDVKDVSTARVRELWIEGPLDPPVLMDLDGEQPGSIPASVRVLEKALFVLR